VETKFSKLSEKEKYTLVALFAYIEILNLSDQMCAELGEKIGDEILGDLIKGVDDLSINIYSFTENDHVNFISSVVKDIYSKVE